MALQNNPYANWTKEQIDARIAELQAQGVQPTAQPQAAPMQANPYMNLSKEELDKRIATLQQKQRQEAENGSIYQKNPVNDALTGFAVGSTQALIDAGLGAFNRGRQASQYIAEKRGEKPEKFKPVKFDFKKELQKKRDFLGGKSFLPQDVDKSFAYGAGDIPGTFVGNVLVPTPKFKLIGKAAEKIIPPIASYLKNSPKAAAAAKTLGQGAFIGGLYGANSENSDPVNDLLFGAATNAGVAGAFKGIGKGVGTAKDYVSGQKIVNYLQKQMDAGLLSAKSFDEIKRRLQRTGDLPVDIGSIVGDSKLQNDYKGAVSAVPTAGIRQKMQKVISFVDNKADALVKGLKKSSDYGKAVVAAGEKQQPQTASFQLLNAIKDNYKSKLSERDLHYQDAVKQIEGLGLNFGESPKLSSAAKKYLQEAKDSRQFNKLSGFTPEEVDAFEKSLSSAQEGKAVPFSVMDRHRKRLGALYSQHKESGDNDKQKIFGELYQAASRDIRDTVNASGNPQLVQTWNKALDVHKNHVMPYRKNGINKIMDGRKSSDNLSKVLSADTNQTVYNHLSPQHKSLLLYDRLTQKAPEDLLGGKIHNPTMILRNYRGLNEAEKGRIVPKEIRKELNDLNYLNEIATGYRPVVKAPETGVKGRNLQVLKTMGAVAGKPVAAAIGGAALGTLGLGNVLGAIGAPAAVYATVKSARKYANQMTDKEIVEAFLDGKNLTKEKFAPTTKISKVANKLSKFVTPDRIRKNIVIESNR